MPVEVHVDDLKVYDFKRGDEPASWLKRDTGLAEHLRALAVADDSSGISAVSRIICHGLEGVKVVNVGDSW